MTGADDFLKEIIRLQLKKPRNWEWQLSTSKSSPHISLPTIQLFNSKGRLVLETNDNRGTKRQTWHSTHYNNDEKLEYIKRGGFLHKCRSDNLEGKITEITSTGSHRSRSPRQSSSIQRCRSDTATNLGNRKARRLNILDEDIRWAKSSRFIDRTTDFSGNRPEKQAASIHRCRSDTVANLDNKAVYASGSNFCRSRHERPIINIQRCRSDSVANLENKKSSNLQNFLKPDEIGNADVIVLNADTLKHRSIGSGRSRSERPSVGIQRCRSDTVTNMENKGTFNVADCALRKGSIETSKKHLSGGVQRCRSDTVALGAPNKSIRSRTNPSKLNNPENTDARNGKLGATRGRSADAKCDYGRKGDPGQMEPKREREDGFGGFHLQKSRSDITEIKVRPTKTQTALSFTESNPKRAYQKRVASDDLFKKLLKYREESLKRAEQDGYKNFINAGIPHVNKKDDDKRDQDEEKKKRTPARCLTTAEMVVCDNKPSYFEVNNVKEKKYKIRQSRAGILVISDESFSSSHRRRCHGESGIGDGEDAEPRKMGTNDLFGPLSSTKESNFGRDVHRSRSEKNNVEDDATTRNRTPGYVRQASDPAGARAENCRPNRYHKLQTNGPNGGEKREQKRDLSPTRNPEKCLFYSKSDVFPFGGLFFDTDDDNKGVKVDDNCNYIVQEPLTTPTSGNSESKMLTDDEDLKRKKRRTIRRGYTEGSSSSSTVEHRRKQQGHIIHPSKSRSKVTDCDLLQLVRRLSSPKAGDEAEPYDAAVQRRTDRDDHRHDVNGGAMGANVSRHSTKGLSGRRSQSSGSICNGKGGRQAGDGSKCGGSLPSYLDDKDSTYNNNQSDECEKPPLDEVDRIPPLGDGAPLHWKFSDAQTALCQDQGYGSERSPEEEYPPPLPDHDLEQCHHHLEPHSCYPFITPESTFAVKLTKGSRGLGLSVTGGIDSAGSWPGLVRIKRLFPHQPASSCGLLNVGDLLLEANGVPLTGLTNYEALEVLRTASNQVELRVCRPPPDVLNCVSPVSDVPPPPPTRREPPNTLNIQSSCFGTTPEDEYYHGEFEVTLTKIQGSLGFTLRKEDDSALGHYVRALVREPALTDGRIRAGDKIIAVNDVEISPMTHEQAVQYLRQCGDKVKLRLYRDSAQTPVATLSPTETTPRTSFSRKANLRQEAVDMLNDIAVRKLIPGNQDMSSRRSHSPGSSPRRLRRHAYSSEAPLPPDPSIKYVVPDEQFHEGLLHKCAHFDDDAFNSLFSIDSDDLDRPSRPSSLDLYNPNQTPVATRKPRFNFSLAHNAYELNNLDAEVLDAPNLTYNLGNDDVNTSNAECSDNFPKEPASMPHIPLDNSCMAFSYRNPAYQSAHPPCSGAEAVDFKQTKAKPNYQPEATSTLRRKASAPKSEEHPPKTKTDSQKIVPLKEEYEILAIELNRGWNSRLGFSLQGAAGVTYVSAVHADSVAAKDGRIKPGDRVIKVNDESVEHMSTSEIIDLLRIVRGPVCIVVKRIKSNEDCPRSNAEN